MMLGLQGNTSSSKVYRCVACSATFTGLASLLVHQATHAGTLTKVPTPPPTQPHSSLNEMLLSSKDLSTEDSSPPAVLAESSSPSFYICDCGEEFHDFNLMLEHKRAHVSQVQLVQPLDNNDVLSGEIGSDNSFTATQSVSFTETITQPSLVLSPPSTSRSPAGELSTLTHTTADESLEDSIAIVTSPPGQCTPPQDGNEKELETSGEEQIPDTVEDIYFKDTTNSGLSRKMSDNLPKNNSIMKILASAYMKRFTSPQSENQNNDTVTPKQQAVPPGTTPARKADTSPVSDLSVAQLKRLLSKPGIKTKAPSISRVLESSKKRIVSLTIMFSPVVLLETRQKLMNPGRDSTYGRYQCTRCRRVFQNLDRLTEHHLLHKKERIKCCRRCKHLIIGKLPLPDNHVCPQLGGKARVSSSPFKNNSTIPQKIVPFHSINNAKKVFFCPICKHSYARRYNLKTHKCQGPMAALSKPTTPFTQKIFTLRSNNTAKTDSEIQDESDITKTVGVGTELAGHIKVEDTSSNSDSAVSQLTWTPAAKTFTPFYSQSSTMEQQNNVTLSGTSLLQEEESNSWDAVTEQGENRNEGQWTIPLDDDMQAFTSAERACNLREVNNPVSVNNAGTAPTSLRYFVSDGVKRYPCNKCQKTYSRPSTLRRHLRLCGFRPRVLGSVAQNAGAIALNPNTMKPLFSCFVCGRHFNRKDNMMVHRRKCQLRRTMPANVDGGALQSLPGNSSDCQTAKDDGSNWGIMSLPSVLPRRVTCECGVGFTSPRLLLEHLQKHAQESYTCPTCGETVGSWADYEIHLQIHMHPHHQLLKGLQPQRSQPLLLRFQQQPPPPQKQPPAEHPPNPGKKQQRIVCMKCGNTFATRCSLRRHISLNRCKGARVSNATNPAKTYHCSHCNSDFPNTISLMFHQRSGACKPTIKPVRCPTCLRWFGTVEGLQKHLLTHKQSESYRCDVCQGTYHSLKSLKNHRRRIHRIMAGNTMLKTQEQLTS